VLIVLAAVILLAVGGGLLNLGLYGQIMASRTAAQISARTAADAGLTKAIFEMNQALESGSLLEGDLPSATGEELEACNATYSYSVTTDADGRFVVVSTGNSLSSERTVRATLRLRGLFDDAIYARDSILLTNNSLVDANGSDIATDPNGSGTLILRHATLVGDVKLEERFLPEIVPPTNEEFEHSLGAIDSTTTITENGLYEEIDLNNGDQITVQGDVILYISGDIDIDQGSGIHVLPASSLVIFLGGNWTQRNLSLVNTQTLEPKRLQVYAVGEDQEFIFDNQVVFCGVIYAPGASVYLNNNVSMEGAIVAESVELANHSDLTYDQGLSEVDVTDLGVRFVVKRWSEE